MRAMMSNWSKVALVLMGMAMVASQGAVWAEETVTTDLAFMKTFEAQEYQGSFNNTAAMVPPEVVQYVNKELSESDLVEYQSPGDGVLRFSCVGSPCRTLEVKLEDRKSGAVVWSGQEKMYYWYYPYYERNHHKVAESIVNKLHAAYQQAVNAQESNFQNVNYERIEVPEE